MTEAEIAALIAALPTVYQEVIKLIDAARAGTVTAADATAGLKALTDDVTANNAAIDAEVAEKTP
jgi:hypothetical protein